MRQNKPVIRDILYPSKKLLCTFGSDRQNYYFYNKVEGANGLATVAVHRKNFIKGDKYTRSFQVFEAGRVVEELNLPDVPRMDIVEGSYQKKENGILKLDGVGVVDFKNGIETLYADKEKKIKLEESLFNRADFSTKLKTTFYPSGSIATIIPYKDNLPHGDMVVHRDMLDPVKPQSGVKAVKKYEQGELKYVRRFGPNYTAHDESVFEDISTGTYKNIKYKPNGSAITWYVNDLVDQRKVFDANARLVEDHRFAAGIEVMIDFYQNGKLTRSRTPEQLRANKKAVPQG